MKISCRAPSNSASSPAPSAPTWRRITPRSTPRSRRCRAAPATAASAAARRRAAPSPRSAAAGPLHARAAERQLGMGGDLADAPGEDLAGRRSARCPRSSTASAVGFGAGAGHQPRRRGPTMLASRVIRAVSSRVAAFICRCHIGAEKTAAAEVRALEQRAQADAAAHRVRDEIARPGQPELGRRGRAARRRRAGTRGSPRRGRASGLPAAGRTAPGRASRSPRPRSRAPTSRPATRPYFSANSVRPGNSTAVPRRPPAQATALSRTPSAAVSQKPSPPAARRRRRRGRERRGHAEQAGEPHREPHVALDRQPAAHEGARSGRASPSSMSRKVSALAVMRAVGVAVVGPRPALVDPHRALVLDDELDRALDPLAAQAPFRASTAAVDGFAHGSFSGCGRASPRFPAMDH